MKDASLVNIYLNTDHVQNIFVTDDNFTVVYFVLDNALTWLIALDEYSDDLEYFDDVSIIENLLTSAQHKIKNGDMDSAKELQSEINSRYADMTSTNEIAAIKEKLSELIPGYPTRMRLPLL